MEKEERKRQKLTHNQLILPVDCPQIKEEDEFESEPSWRRQARREDAWLRGDFHLLTPSDKFDDLSSMKAEDYEHYEDDLWNLEEQD